MDVTKEHFDELRSLGFQGRDLMWIIDDLSENLVTMEYIRNPSKAKLRPINYKDLVKIRRMFSGAGCRI